MQQNTLVRTQRCLHLGHSRIVYTACAVELRCVKRHKHIDGERCEDIERDVDHHEQDHAAIDEPRRMEGDQTESPLQFWHVLIDDHAEERAERSNEIVEIEHIISGSKVIAVCQDGVRGVEQAAKCMHADQREKRVRHEKHQHHLVRDLEQSGNAAAHFFELRHSPHKLHHPKHPENVEVPNQVQLITGHQGLLHASEKEQPTDDAVKDVLGV
mmetsp:Transcript_50135/g.133175  ORF Transcript_50135/g.133175 Transcript_50135/m.133175 type:complete len:213 (-) Transcript_50135:1366-2004(-)